MTESESRLRVGVVGVNNRIRRVILKGLAAGPRATVAAVCSRSLEKARSAAAEYGGQPFDSYEAMLASGLIDAVVVETPPELHHPMSMAALARGLHVACEKPLATSVAQAREMEEAARRAGLRTAVNFTYRSMALQRYFAEVIEAGEIGDLLHFSIGYWQGRQLLPETPVRDALEDLGPHTFDALRWWAGAAGAGEVAGVFSLKGSDVARGVPAGSAVSADRPIWQGIIEMENGATGTAQISRVALGYANGVTASFHGTKGAVSLAFDVDEGTVSLARLGKVRPEGRWTPLQIPPELQVSYEAFPAFHLDRIVGALRGEGAFTDFADGRKVQEIQEAALSSAVEGRWISL
jgi:predicted dehydrogenase